MTLTTRAEHEHGREVAFVFDEAPSNPYAIAERHVFDLEAQNGTEADPHEVDADDLAREAAEEAREDMEEAASLYTEYPGVAEDAGERAFERAWDYTRELIDESPVLEAV